MIHDTREGGSKESPRHLLHLVDHIGHLQEVALRAVELHVPTTRPGDIRRVPGLERGDQFGQELASTKKRILDLVRFDSRLLGVGITLLLHDLIDLGRQRGRIPHHQFRLARRVGPAHQPPRGGRRQGRGCPGPL